MILTRLSCRSQRRLDAAHDGQAGRRVMDELMDHRLRDQAQSLRAVMAAFDQVSHRAAGLGSGGGWLGPASAAYDVAIAALSNELRAANGHLGAALHDTINAISAGSSNAGERCGG